uniref:Uncharacterized protein n=1 Tax=Fagus sylvatica TaxID=28930 RepID=A0A2N9GI01_FAGSY
MAPGSRGVGAVFVHFSGEDSDQTGDAIGEPRVPRRSWSRYLSNAPGLVGSTCCEPERLCARRRLSGRKNAFSSQRVFLQILSQFAHIFDLAPDVRFRRSWYRRKACAAYFCKVPGLRKSELGLLPMSDFDDLGIVGKLVLPIFQRYRPCTEASLGSQDMILRTEAVGMFLMPRGHLLTEIPVQPEELLTIRKLRVVAEVNLLPKGLGSWTKLRVGENLCANVASQIGCFVNNT